MRSSIDGWNRGDVDAWLEPAHPDIEFWTSGVYPGLDPVYRGTAELRRFWNDFRDPWESLQVDVDQLREVGDRVVLLWTFQAHARDGMSVQREGANIWHFVNGLAVRVMTYGSWSEALEAVGPRD